MTDTAFERQSENFLKQNNMCELNCKNKQLTVKLKSTANYTPQYETEGASGMDLRADISETLILPPMGRALIDTGISIEMPQGYEAQVRPRSGLSSKGIVVMWGTVDSDYRGQIKVTIINLSNDSFTIAPNERIAQLVFAKVEKVKWELADELTGTQRGSGGFGSTGMI